MNIKKVIALLTSILIMGTLAGCSNGDDNKGNKTFDNTKEITVISREANSGTRGAFDELMNITVKEGDNTVDKLYEESVLVDSTDAVASKVEVDKYAIGYTSLGAVTDSVKPVLVDGVSATAENVKNGSYKISRPFVLAVKDTNNALINDFLSYVTSTEGQKVVSDKGYISIDTDMSYQPANLSGKLTLSGSTSVEKVIEKIKEEYVALNPNVIIEITYSGSSAGIKDVSEGKVDIGMSSRELKDSEQTILKDTTFAHDGIAVIVNSQNAITELDSNKITAIFTGEIRNWADVE